MSLCHRYVTILKDQQDGGGVGGECGGGLLLIEFSNASLQKESFFRTHFCTTGLYNRTVPNQNGLGSSQVFPPLWSGWWLDI